MKTSKFTRNTEHQSPDRNNTKRIDAREQYSFGVFRVILSRVVVVMLLVVLFFGVCGGCTSLGSGKNQNGKQSLFTNPKNSFWSEKKTKKPKKDPNVPKSVGEFMSLPRT
ncbi:MAG: hypothetical protein LBQ66_05620 [Planctomycetaceae bacterium]|jgi:hypothetical protein|nr:hypothetical protein [Planctomycetaceae bacterium]